MTIPASTSVSELKTQLVSRCGLPEPQQLLSTMGATDLGRIHDSRHLRHELGCQNASGLPFGYRSLRPCQRAGCDDPASQTEAARHATVAPPITELRSASANGRDAIRTNYFW